MSAGNGVKPGRNGSAKTAPKTVGRPFVAGSDTRRGGGKPGRSGRKPDAFLAECERLTDAEVLAKVRAYLKRKDTGPADPWWWKCAEYVTGYGKGKPAQSVKVSQDEDAPPFRFTLDLGAAAIHEGDDE
jgi:hypothetical protein